MKNSRNIRTYSSSAASRLLTTITPLEKLQVGTKMGLAARIDDLVQARGWGKKEFATIVHKNPSEITRWLSGVQNFTVDTLAEIALVLNIPIVELFMSKPDRSSMQITITVTAIAGPSPIQYKTPVEELSFIDIQPMAFSSPATTARKSEKS